MNLYQSRDNYPNEQSPDINLSTDQDIATTKSKVEINEILCPSGVFTMGDTRTAKAFKQRVEIKHPIYIADTLVSQPQWSHYCSNSSNWLGSNLPVERVSWLEAILFCNILSREQGLTPSYIVRNGVITFKGEHNGYRLPFEAEWEYCAKAGTNDYVYAGSDLYDDVAIRNKDRVFADHTRPLKHAKPNAWGIYDMTGNLNEWCNDLYSEAPNQGHIFDIHEKEFTFDLMSARDFALFNVVAKGGSWFNSPDYSKVYSRHCYNIMYPSSMVGIRLVRNA